MFKYYILQDKKPVLVERESSAENLKEWMTWFGSEERQIHTTRAGDENDKTVISTVFIGVGEESSRTLFETMIFNGKYHGLRMRSDTYEEATDDHNFAVAVVKGECQLDQAWGEPWSRSSRLLVTV